MIPYFTVLLFLKLFIASNTQSTNTTNLPTKPTIRVGIAATQRVQPESIGWSYCGGAVAMALKKMQEKGIASNFNFEFYVEYTECDRASTVKAGLEFVRKKVDVIVGPPCAEALKVMGTLANIYSKPVMGWGYVSDSQLSDATRFPYVASVLSNSQTLGYATAKLLETYKFDKIALFYMTNELNYCKSIVNDVESALNDPTSYQVQIVMKAPLNINNDDSYNATLDTVKTRARGLLGLQEAETAKIISFSVILFCAQTATEKRNYLIKLGSRGMDSDEYVHIMLSMRSIGYGAQVTVSKTKFTMSGLAPVWEASFNGNDGFEALAKRAASKMLVLDLNSEVSDIQYMQYMQKNIIPAVRAPPINCNTTECQTANISGMAAYARHLYDAFYLYGIALNNLNTTDPAIYQNITTILPQFVTTFDGMTGEVSMNQNLSRQPYYQLYGLDPTYDQISLLNLSIIDGATRISLAYTDEAKAVWYFWNGTRPLATPICGFLGKSCPQTFMQKYGILIFVGAIVIIFTIITFLIFMICLMRNKREEQRRINAEWQIPSIKLKMPEKKKVSGSQSKRSLQSAPSTVTGDSHVSVNSEFHENYSVQFYEKDIVLTTKHQSMTMTRNDMERFAKLRKLDHENLNKFIGLSIDGPQFVAVWKMCARGSLQDIILRGNFSMDAFFMFCIIRDIAEGLYYLHHSFLRVHGNLRSATCLVNDSWQVKLADFGLDIILEEDTPPKKRLLWVSPEVLRASTLPSNMDPSADVYSFAIVASEILTKKEAWDLAERKESPDEIIYLVKKGGDSSIRPDLIVDGMEVNASLLQLVKDCWSERPDDRPPTEDICKVLREMMPKTKTNLMDHVFNMLEEYTSTLELEVEERTKELTVEKKKADILLGKMLPKQVAERLKQGQTVEPEGFDSVSVFFSDVVKFTILATKCSPFQVVNLLNDLYSNFDSIIEEHGVYKVESIGDGYLCVSGLPIRIGFAHIKQIVDMSLAFMNYVKTFKIPHLPRERVELRIGINSGPCVAGVVGLSMPRYCLFGDTVNTASRMESNGKASYIHMSTAAHDLLTSHYPRQYETHSRGEVIIKGKGVMETFWVLDRIDGIPSNTTSRKLPTPPTNENVKSTRNNSIPLTVDTPESLARSISPISDYVNQKSSDDDALYRQYRRDTLKVI